MNTMQQVADWLEEYGHHIGDCDFLFISAWEPGRGFKVRGAWQPDEPKCGCGYNEALKQVREWADNPEAKA